MVSFPYQGLVFIALNRGIMKKFVWITLILALISSRASAQTAYCDTTPPTSGNGTVGTVMTVQVCISPNDTNGNPVTPSAWTLYDNNVSVGAIVMTKGSTAPVSGLIQYTGSYTPNVVGSHSLQLTATGNGKESAKSAAFLLTASNPPSAPAAPVKLSLQ